MARIRKANKVLSSEIDKACPATHSQYTFSAARPNELNQDMRDDIWRIFEENMYHLYVDSSFGWKPAEKKLELFHDLTRYLIVRDARTLALVAFTAFRFEREEDENLLYCYEIHVSKKEQRQGLGHKLMENLVAIGAKWFMQKIMLTVLKENPSAINFYEGHSFTIDPTSPSQCPEDEETDYEIMSRVLGSQ